MLSHSLRLKNKLGLHIRAASKLVNLSSQFTSEIKIIYNKKSINTKRILNLMGSGLKLGDEFILEINGDDEQLAMEKLTDFILNKKLGDPE